MDKRQAWADFWINEQRPDSRGCLAEAGDGLAGIQERAWQEFAVSLPRGASVLDLGTGDGAVLKRLRAKRPDLRLTGVDSASRLSPPPTGIRLKAGVAIESLPYPDAGFDAVTSQFGYEYGRTAEAAAEVARVLKPAGRFLFIVHHRAGPVVAHNQARAAALRWAASGSGLLAKARSLSLARRTMPLATPASFREAVAEAARQFPGQPVAIEVAQATLQSLDPRLGPDASLAYLAELERKAAAELTRLDALAAAARDEAGVLGLVSELREAGLDALNPEPLVLSQGVPLAWRLAGRR